MSRPNEPVKYNDKPIMLANGKVYDGDGHEVLDAVTFTISAHLKNWTGKTLGADGKRSTRVTGVEYDGTITRRKTTPWTKQFIQDFKDGKVTEFTVQGQIADQDSDYYAKYGNETVTAYGCIPTGDLTLFEANVDSEDARNDTINFNIYDVVYS